MIRPVLGKCSGASLRRLGLYGAVVVPAAYIAMYGIILSSGIDLDSYPAAWFGLQPHALETYLASLVEAGTLRPYITAHFFDLAFSTGYLCLLLFVLEKSRRNGGNGRIIGNIDSLLEWFVPAGWLADWAETFTVLGTAFARKGLPRWPMVVHLCGKIACGVFIFGTLAWVLFLGIRRVVLRISRRRSPGIDPAARTRNG